MRKFLIIFLICVTLCIIPFFAQKKEHENELVFWTLQLSGFSDYFNNIIAEFEKENPEIKIKWIDVPYSEGEKRTLASIMGKNPPDLINLNPDFSIMLSQIGALKTFSKDDLQQFNPQITKLLNDNGKYYGIPFYATSSITYINKGITQKAGINKAPETYELMYQKAGTIKAKTGKYVTEPTICENDTMIKILNKYGISKTEDLKSKEALMILDEYKLLYESNEIPKESLTQGHRDALEKYMSGQIAYLVTGSNFLNIIKENAPQVLKNTDVSYQLTQGKGEYDCSLMNFIIPLRAKNPEYALKFALFLTNEKNQLEFAKLTGVLPVNSKALKNPYFSKTDRTLESKARKISAEQLNKLIPPFEYGENQKETISEYNQFVQKYILNK